MIKYLVASLALALSCASAQAATWYLFTKNYTDTSLYYFDLDTVTKQSSTVTIWVKTVNDPNYPYSDGIYGVATKDFYDCAKRTSQILTMSTYNKSEHFIRTYSKSEAQDVVPGSIGEGILKTVCAPDFPKNKSRDRYVPVEGNDIFKNAADYFEYVRAAKADPAPK